MIAVGDENGEVKVFGFEDGHILYLSNGHSSPVTHAVISPDCKILVSGDSSGGILIWKLKYWLNVFYLHIRKSLLKIKYRNIINKFSYKFVNKVLINKKPLFKKVSVSIHSKSSSFESLYNISSSLLVSEKFSNDGHYFLSSTYY